MNVVRTAFLKYDTEGKGALDKQELKVCLKEMDYKIKDKDLKIAYKVLDINKDGTIDYNDFRTWYLNG